MKWKAEGDDPPALKSRVILKKSLRKYRDMFTDLSSQRTFNEAGLQSIEMSAIESYLNIDGETRKEHRKFARRVILEMDAVFMEHVRKQHKKNSPSK